MADANVVSQILDLLPAEAKIKDTLWNAAVISDILDQGNSVNQVMSRFWNARSAETATLVDISESGSSRSLSTVHENAVRMARYWDDRVKSDSEDAEEVATRRNRVAFHRITRV